MVRGSHVMAGYWKDEEATASMLRPGPLPGERVLRSGDLFSTDDEGFLYFKGRSDNIIKTRGEKVSPREVEDALHARPEVQQAAVVGEADKLLGQAIVAHVVLRGGSTIGPAELVAHCKEQLEDFMVPKRIRICDSLPKTESGKVARKRLVSVLE